MDTFSIAVGRYQGFQFRVNPVNSALVEFVHPDADGNTVIQQFNRNGGMAGPPQVIPVNQTQLTARDPHTGVMSVKPEENKVEPAKPIDGFYSGSKEQYDPETGAQSEIGARNLVQSPTPTADTRIPLRDNRTLA